MATAQTPRRTRRHVWWIVLAVALLALMAAIVFVVVNPSAIAQRVTDRVLPQLSERLGRQVSVERVEVDLIPRPRARVLGVQVAGGEGEPPFVAAEKATATLRLWPLIRSMGDQIEVESVELQGPELTLVRRANGEWSHDEVLEGLKQTAPEEPPTPEEESTRVIEIGQLALRDGAVRLVDHSAAGQPARAAFEQIDLTIQPVIPGQPAQVELSGALLSSSPNLTASLSVEPLPGGDETGRPKVSGDLKVQRLSVPQALRFLSSDSSTLLSGGVAALDAAVRSGDDGALTVQGGARVDELRLRGQPANGRFNFTASMNPDKEGSLVASLRDISLNGPGVDLGGQASMSMQPRRVQFDLAGRALDLDTLLGVLPDDEPAAQADDAGPVLPESVRQELARTQVRGSLTFREVRSGKLVAQNMKADARLDKGVLVLEEGQAQVYGGEVSLKGTRVDLSEPKPQWRLTASVQQMQLGQAMQQLAGVPSVEGGANLRLDVQGAGDEWEEIRKQLTGQGSMSLTGAALTRENLGGKLVPVLSQSLQALGRGSNARQLEQLSTGRTTLGDVATTYRVDDGWLVLNDDISFDAGFGEVSVGGRIGLDQRLDLDGTVALSPQFLSSVFPAFANLSAPVVVPIGLGGTLSDVQVEPFKADAFARALLESQVAPQQSREKAKELEDKVRNEANQRLRGLFGG